MDDIQFWLYLLFAIIYFISRGLKKKVAPKPPERPHASVPQQENRRKPVTFEELLREFTEGRENPEEEPEHQSEPERKEIRVERQVSTPSFEEGTTRVFSDEESRRVYEESIKRAEGAALQFEREEPFRSKLKRRHEEEGEQETVASDIKKMLRDPGTVRRAVVLSEILNRRY